MFQHYQDPRFPPLSPSIYWTIRSLPVYYEAVLQEANRAGAPPILELHDEEWPDAPEGEENFDTGMMPDWLVCILTLDNVHEWGMTEIRSFRGDRLRMRRSFWHNPGLDNWKEIPVKELDDPPDSDGDSLSGGGIISELMSEGMSTNIIEDNN